MTNRSTIPRRALLLGHFRSLRRPRPARRKLLAGRSSTRWLAPVALSIPIRCCRNLADGGGTYPLEKGRRRRALPWVARPYPGLQGDAGGARPRRTREFGNPSVKIRCSRSPPDPAAHGRKKADWTRNLGRPPFLGAGSAG